MGNVYDELTARDWSTRQPKIVGKLAESFEQSQSDPKTWRFKLRQGLQVHQRRAGQRRRRGEHGRQRDRTRTSRASALTSTALAGAKATKVDDFTVDITTGAVDAIFPSRAAKMPIPAPKWLATMPNDASITQAVGSGPYKLVEYVKGDHFLLKANPDYWGPNKPTIAEIKIVFRNEAAVRASMLQAGEVQLATLLTPEAGQADAGQHDRADRRSRSASGSTPSIRCSRTCGCARRSTWRSIARA